MAVFLYLIAIVWLIFGLGMLIIPETIRKMYEGMAKIKDFRPMAAIPIIIGILFLLSTDSVMFPALVHVLGIIAILKGLMTLTMKKEKVAEVIRWWIGGPVIMIRMWGVLCLGFAILVFKAII